MKAFGRGTALFLTGVVALIAAVCDAQLIIAMDFSSMAGMDIFMLSSISALAVLGVVLFILQSVYFFKLLATPKGAEVKPAGNTAVLLRMIGLLFTLAVAVLSAWVVYYYAYIENVYGTGEPNWLIYTIVGGSVGLITVVSFFTQMFTAGSKL